MKAGEALVRLLEAYEVDTVFGIPGTHSLELYRGLAGSGIRHVSPRHEQGGGFMADGYARVSGKPGVCFVITGPGVTNIATPLGQAYMDSVPMLVISPVNTPDPGRRNVGRLHEITDQAAVTAPLTAFSAVANDAGARRSLRLDGDRVRRPRGLSSRASSGLGIDRPPDADKAEREVVADSLNPSKRY